MTQALRIGFVVGLLTIIFTNLAYNQGMDSKMIAPVYWGSYLFYILGMYLVASRTKSEVDDKTKLRHAFVVFIVANLMYNIFIYVYFGIWHPELQEVMMRGAMQAHSVPSEGFSPNHLELSIPSVVFAFVQSCIPGFVLAWGIVRLTKH